MIEAKTEGRGTYRPDIDGLRAVAVVAVVLFHSGAGFIAGGFLGVDVFFVISGFLITGILVRENRSGTYTLASFYNRRIRRLFPALFVMLACTTAVSALILLPSELETYARSLFSTALFSSNIYYWLATNYFSPAAEDNPLLHTWSLAVEEQFYLVAPLLIYAIFRLRLQRLLPVIVAVGAILSLAAAEWVVRREPTAAFYLLPFRAWELLIGSCVALFPIPALGARAAAAVGIAGLGAILASFVLLDSYSPIPGVVALLPSIGAAAVLIAGRDKDSPVSRLMSLRPVTGMGLISYSLYLWHWPLLVLPRLHLERDLKGAEISALMSAALIISYASWRFVERPFRNHQKPPWRAIAAGTAGVAAFAAISLTMFNGLPSRVPPRVAELDLATKRAAGRVPGCVIDSTNNPTDLSAKCLALTGRRSIILWGDSHAEQYAVAIDKVAQQDNKSFKIISRTGCPPLPETAIIHPNGQVQTACSEFNARAIKAVLDDPEAETVILAGRWGRFFFPRGNPEMRRLVGGPEAMRRSLSVTLQALMRSGKRVILIGQSPEFQKPLAACLARAAWRHIRDDICRHMPETLPGAEWDLTLARALPAGATYLKPSDILCRQSHCLRMLDGIPTVRDSDHLSAQTAAWIVSYWFRSTNQSTVPVSPTTVAPAPSTAVIVKPPVVLAVTLHRLPLELTGAKARNAALAAATEKVTVITPATSVARP